MEKHDRLNITLPQSLAGELSKVAKESSHKKSHIIARALELYFDELDGIIAENRMKKLEAGDTKVVSADKVWQALGL